jgi:hypothetical protein
MIQDWWNDIVGWFTSSEGRRVLADAVLPFLAILVAGIIAGLIARGGMKRLVGHQERQAKASAVAALVAAGRRAATWTSLSASEKDHVDHQVAEAEVRLRLLPVSGAGLAADWAAHHLAALKRNSTSYGYQSEQDLREFQDGMIAWQNRPSRARKLFAQDLAAWQYEQPSADDEIVARQREWAAQQAASPTEPLLPEKA